MKFVRLGDIADVNWGDTRVTKSSYVSSGDRFLAYSASGPDGELPYFDYDRIGVVVSAIGANAGASWLTNGKWSCIKNTIRFFSLDETVADTRYLFWATRGTKIWPLRGSAQQFIAQQDARNLRVPLPPIADQRMIAETLGVIAGKLESSRQTLQLAWELMSALYARMAADGEEVELGDLLRLEYGKALPANRRRPGDVLVYGSNGIAGSHDEPLIDGPAVIVGRKGSIGEVHWSHHPCFPIDTTFYVVPCDEYPLLGCYFALLEAGLQSRNSDSAVPGLNRHAALSVRVLAPSVSDARQWAVGCEQMLSHVQHLGREITVLESLRDALLPELLAGRMEVPEGSEAVA